MAEQSITLAPGESKVVSFEATPHEAKTYQVSVNGLTGSFVAKAAPLVVGDPKSFAVLDIEGVPFISVGEDYTLTKESLYTQLLTSFIRLYRNAKAYAPDTGGLWISEAACQASAQWLVDNAINWQTRALNYSSLAAAMLACFQAHPEWFTAYVHKNSSYCASQMVYGTTVTESTLKAKAIFATLAHPIQMSPMRGVTLHCSTAIMQPAAAGITGYFSAHLWYTPTFYAEMSPPAFRGFHNWITSSKPEDWGKVVEFDFAVTSCFGGGYYYDGLYQGRFSLASEFTTPAGGGGGVGLLGFYVKNLAQVTGKGTVSP